MNLCEKNDVLPNEISYFLLVRGTRFFRALEKLFL